MYRLMNERKCLAQAVFLASTVLVTGYASALVAQDATLTNADKSVSRSTDVLSNRSLLATPSLSVKEVETVLDLTPVIDIPEGIAIDHQGNIFVSNKRLDGDERISEILRIGRDNTVSIFATLDVATAPEAFTTGIIGLAVDSRGDLYAAVASQNPETHGVWRFQRGGGSERLVGSKRMKTPNALAFDPRGNLYVTDSEAGTIWRFPPDGPGRLWLRHELLSGGIGANGIAFVPPRSLFVANTDQALIARIPIQPSGDPGDLEVAAAGFELLTVDGLAADVHGNLHAVIAGASIFGTAPLGQVNPATGEITPSTDQWEKFDFPTSLAFGRGPRDHKSVYVVNSGLFPEGRPDAAPGVVRVSVGVPGFPSR